MADARNFAELESINDGKQYLKNMMSLLKWATLEGYNVRRLHRYSGLSREEFMSDCMNTIRNVENMGTSESERKLYRNMAIRRLSEKSLFFFGVFVLGMDYINNDYCYRLCLDVQDNKWNKKLWVIARDHFKSTIITKASTLWELMNHPERTYLIISYNFTTSQKFLSDIKIWCETCPLLYELWPDIFWKNPAQCKEIQDDGSIRTWTWTQTMIELKPKRISAEKSIVAGSIEGGAQTGSHFTHIIYDDSETQDSVTNGESIERLYEKISMSFNTGQTQSLNYCFVGTFYATEDVYVRMIKRGVITEAIIQPACEDDGTPVCYSVEQVMEKIKNLGSMTNVVTQIFCEPSAVNASSFKREWIQIWNPVRQGLNVYIIVDPSSNKQKATGDFMAIWVVGIDYLGTMKVLDLIRDKLNATTKFKTLSSLYAEYRPDMVYYEEESMQSDISMLRIQMDQYNMHFPIIPFSMKRKGSKNERMEQLQWPLSTGKIWFPEHCFHTNYQGKYEDMMETFIRDEYDGYPTASHDDAMDALATAWLMLSDGLLQVPLDSANGPYVANDRYMLEDDYDCYSSM